MSDVEKGSDYDMVLGMSNSFFRNTTCTFDSIKDFITKMAGFSFNQEQMRKDLENQHMVSVPHGHSVMEDTGDHDDWINLTTQGGLKRAIDWHYWRHYEDYLVQEKGFPKSVVKEISESTCSILSRIEDPLRAGLWDRRGLVMGSVQSGKTANYTGLIARAIDTGYKIIVVLTGVHNSLRSQTQLRLNDELLGYDAEKAIMMKDVSFRKIGIGKYPGHREKNGQPCFIQSLTTSNEKGDFKISVARSAGFVQSEPYVLVVKKQVSILKNLVDWLGSVAGEEDEDGRLRVNKLPLLVIDDECDQASVNTNAVARDDKDQTILEECDPTKTNMRIRQLLTLFDKSAYVGYTATPYANVFIHDDIKHPKYGDDLFPRNFIFNLSQPDNYVGAAEVFGIKDDNNSEQVEPLPILAPPVTDGQDLFPVGHKKDLFVAELPESMIRAIKSFILSSAARRIRETKNPHNTMLIHVTRFTDVQDKVKSLVQSVVKKLNGRISSSDPLLDLEEIWSNDFLTGNSKMLEMAESGASSHAPLPAHSWEEVKEHLTEIIRRTDVVAINGTSQDVLSYKDAEDTARKAKERGEEVRWEDRGAHLIAVGGDKLSRGLTLEGLTVTYYLRPSSMYDTLMQMGRWFGYRPGYLDLCRIYTTKAITDYFRQIAQAEINLRQQFDNMALLKMEPKDFGLSVLEDPGMLMVTGAGKRRDTEVVDQNFSGKVSATVNFSVGKAKTNLNVLNNLVLACESGEKCSDIGSHHWKGVPREAIVDFLNSYGGSEEATLVQPNVMANFIREQSAKHLANWDVVILSKKNPAHSFTARGNEIGCFKRVANKNSTKDSISIGTLLSPQDEWLDFSETERVEIEKSYRDREIEKGREDPGPGKPPGPYIRYCRPQNRGLLLIYAICSSEKPGLRAVQNREKDSGAPIEYGLTEGEEIYGFVASFPSGHFKKIRTRVNTVYIKNNDLWGD